MARNISSALLAYIQQDAALVATCCRVVRTDGTLYGFTTSDMPFTYTFITTPDSVGAVNYTPLNSFIPSTITSDETTGVDNVELDGIAVEATAAIAAADLKAGRFDNARITLFLVNPTDLTMGEMIKVDGYVGLVTSVDGMYKIEVLSKSANLKKFCGIVASPTCRVQVFGDNQCKYDVASITLTGQVAIDVVSNIQFGFVNSHTVNAAGTGGYFMYGLVTFNSGLNSGITREVKSSTYLGGINTLVMKEGFPYAIAALDEFTIVPGCDRTWASCLGWSNANNFRGEPFLPGNALTTQVGRAPQST